MKKILLLSTLSIFALKAETISLNEARLIKMIELNPPTKLNIEATYEATALQSSQAKDAYSTTLSASTSFSESEEKSLSSFSPTTTNYKYYNVAVSRPLKYGATLSAEAYSEQYNLGTLQDHTTHGIGASLSLDLYQDFFGRTSRATLDLRETSMKRALLEKGVSLATFKNNLRKIYWSLVANSEAKRITQTLLSSSKKQLSDGIARKKNGIADEGEVARYQSQVATRQAALINLEWQETQLHQELKLLIPELVEKNIVLEKYNLNNTVDKVLACTAEIRKHSEAPLSYTVYDEIISLLNQEQSKQEIITKNYDDFDVELTGQYDSTGKAFGRSEAYDDFRDDRRDAYTVGLTFSMPLEGKKRDSREVKQIVERKQYEALKKSQLMRVKTFHEQTVKAVDLLTRIVANQRQNTAYLNTAVKNSEKKYKQARISTLQLIQEQDSYLQSNLDEVQTKLAVIHVILDYFNIFNEMPCDLNRI